MTARKPPKAATVDSPVVVAASPPCAATAGTPPLPPVGGVPAPHTWRLELPAGLKVLTLNDTFHWAEVHRRRQSLKKATWVMALNAKIPHLQKATVSIEYQPPDLRERDEDNMAATAKPCIDGLVAAKVFNNDSSKYVSYGGCTISKSLWPRGRVTVIITEVTQ